jgi:hypothetical protein
VFWKKLKNGKTDAETAFDILAATLSMAQKNHLRENLGYVQDAILIAEAAEPTSWQVQEAKKWVRGAFERLDTE